MPLKGVSGLGEEEVLAQIKAKSGWEAVPRVVGLVRPAGHLERSLPQVPASGAKERFFGSVFESCENMGRAIYASRPRRPHTGKAYPPRASPAEPSDLSSRAAPGLTPSQIPLGLQAPERRAHSSQWQGSLSGDKECCPSSFPRQAQAWSCQAPRTVS